MVALGQLKTITLFRCKNTDAIFAGCRETDDLKWSGSDHGLDHYLARKDRIVAHIFENGKG